MEGRTKTEHERVDIPSEESVTPVLSGLRTVPFLLEQNPMNNIIPAIPKPETERQYPFIKLIEEWEIRNGDLAKIAHVQQPRVSDYTSGKPVSNMVARRVEQAVRDIVPVYRTLSSLRIVLDPESFTKAVEIANIMENLCIEVAG